MNATPVRVFKIDWSRNPLNVWANGANAEPEVAVETAQDLGASGFEVVELVVVELWVLAVLVIFPA